MRIDKDAYKKAVDKTMEQMKSQEMYCRSVNLAEHPSYQLETWLPFFMLTVMQRKWERFRQR